MTGNKRVYCILFLLSNSGFGGRDRFTEGEAINKIIGTDFQIYLEQGIRKMTAFRDDRK